VISDFHRKCIYTFFILTILLGCVSLCMMIVEKPYYQKWDCNVTGRSMFASQPFDKPTNPTADIVCKTEKVNGEPSAVLNTLINLTIISGAIFLMLAGLGFVDRRKHPEDYPVKSAVQDEGDDPEEPEPDTEEK